ncbi:MAG: methyltransferase domain-containing protein [Candidatus Rokubacteria bacterium]|nr:methyltransferase domain-containing protein [Candidatus Rokubacteria bacterium]
MNQSLRGTHTLENLKVGFLREAQANLRYHFFARRADMKRLHEVARILRSAADEESGHAFGHLDLLLDFGGEQRDLACERMEDNLKSAIEAELHEFTTLYRGFEEGSELRPCASAQEGDGVEPSGDARRLQGRLSLHVWPGVTPHLDPAAYRRWYETPLGAQADADEKRVVFGLADLRRAERVLDLGCGDGNYTAPIADTTGGAIGVDRSPAMLRAGRSRLGNRPDVVWIQADGASLPFRSARFDVVISVTVLCFAGDPSALLAEAFRVLRPGGRIVVGELGRYSPWALVRKLKGLVAETIYRQAHFFSRSELAGLLMGIGFHDVRVRSAVFYPPINARAALGWLHVMEPIGRWLAPWAGAFLVAVARRPA